MNINLNTEEAAAVVDMCKTQIERLDKLAKEALRKGDKEALDVHITQSVNLDFVRRRIEREMSKNPKT